MKKKKKPVDIKQAIKAAEEAISKAVSWRDMRILWHSVSPHLMSGYGTVTRYVLTGLANRGFPVFASAYFGIQPPGILNYHGIYVLPVKKRQTDQLGFISVKQHYEKFQCDLGIFHADFWVSLGFAKRIKYSLCYSPVDHENYPEKWLNVFRAYKWIAVPSLHAQKELKKSGIEATYVPHGYNPKIYFPMDKEACRKLFTLDKDKFIVGIVAANNDDETRKGWGENFKAFKIFLDNNPDAKKDARLFVHSDYDNEKGRNLQELAKQIGVSEYIIWNDKYTASVIALPESGMAKLYNCFDVFLLLSRREGFCLPVLEAQACGVPAIVNGFSALPERVNYGKCGWVCKPAALVYSPLNAISSIADPYRGADALEEAYNNESKRKLFSKRGIQYAKKFTWELTIDKYWMPLLKEIGEEIPRTSSRKKPKKIAGN